MPENKLIESLDRKIAKIPDDTPNKAIWDTVFLLLISHTDSMNNLEKEIKGNGKDGLIDRVNTLEDRVKVIQSDVRETLNMVRKVAPERTWFIEKVLPGLTIALITGVFATVLTLVIINAEAFIR